MACVPCNHFKSIKAGTSPDSHLYRFLPPVLSDSHLVVAGRMPPLTTPIVPVREGGHFLAVVGIPRHIRFHSPLRHAKQSAACQPHTVRPQ